MLINDLTITSLETITAFSIGNGAFRFALDELQNATIANTQEKTDITGKGGRKLNSLKKNKAVVVSGTNGLLSNGLTEVQTGSKFEDVEATPILWTDYLTITGNASATTYKAVGTTGNEIENIYILNNNVRGEKLTQDATAGEGKFAYDPDTKAITFNDGDYEDGTEIVVYYFRKVPGSVISNRSDVYSEKVQLYIDAFAEDSCNKAYRVQFYIPKADFSGNFDYALGGDQTVHAFEAESLAGSCGSGGSLWTYTIIGMDAEDAA